MTPNYILAGFFFKKKKNIYSFDREREQAGEVAGRGRGRRILPKSREPDAGPGFMTWAEGSHLTDWTTQVPTWQAFYYETKKSHWSHFG